MITNAVLLIVGAVIGFFDGLLPSFSLPSWVSADSILPESWVSTVGGFLHPLTPFFPVDTALNIIGGFLALWPFVAGYALFSWVWAHVPIIAGFGTGDG